jgi:ribosomal protein L33
MNDKIIQRKLVKIICEYCGNEFYTEAGSKFS